MAAPTAAPPSLDAADRGPGRARSWPARAAAIAVVAVMVTLLAVPVSGVSGRSMEPTLGAGDRVALDVWTPRLTGWRRGDVVALEPPASSGTSAVLVKRVVGVGGDVVALRDGVLRVNRHVVVEAYADPDRIDSVFFGPVRVPADHVFVLGDNRRESVDSREFGAVPTGSLRGRVVARVWPLPHGD